mgnify:CR=1 FL=1
MEPTKDWATTYYLASDRNQKVEYEERINKVKKRCCAASGARLAYSDAKQLLEKAVATDEVWAFTLSQFTK